MMDSLTPDRIRAYILGRVSDDEHDAIDERIISSQEFFESVEILEDELISDYVADKLPSSERAAFEKERVRRPELRDKAQLHRELQALATRIPGVGLHKPREPFRGWRSVRWAMQAATATILMACIVAGYFILESRREPASISAAQQTATRAQTPPSGESNPRPQQDLLPVTAFLLLPLTRAEQGQERLRVPASDTNVELRFSIGPDANYETYRVVVHSVGGKDILDSRGLEPRDISNYRVVSVILPLSGRDSLRCEATVLGTRRGGNEIPIEDYSFMIAR